MTNKNIKNLCRLLLVYVALLTFTSCSNGDDEAPRIDSVWFNMVSRPIEQASCAYAGQTICLRGSGFGDLRKLIVNGTSINLTTLYVYASDNNITFQLPSDVKTTGDRIRVVTGKGMCDFPFVVRPKDEQPAITAFSSTTLIPSRTLTITGTFLGGATEVWLPLAFGDKVSCAFDETQENDDETVHVIIPEDVTFATGRCEVVMEKYDEERDIYYTEKVYSSSTNFTN
ncbi:MAG: hypothetical protein IJ552_04040 [Prevotella sp.]|nr:hypothetical protein [Prevotella sp.]